MFFANALPSMPKRQTGPASSIAKWPGSETIATLLERQHRLTKSPEFVFPCHGDQAIFSEKTECSRERFWSSKGSKSIGCRINSETARYSSSVI
jgi:hypothetical protein